MKQLYSLLLIFILLANNKCMLMEKMYQLCDKLNCCKEKLKHAQPSLQESIIDNVSSLKQDRNNDSKQFLDKQNDSQRQTIFHSLQSSSHLIDVQHKNFQISPDNKSFITALESFKSISPDAQNTFQTANQHSVDIQDLSDNGQNKVPQEVLIQQFLEKQNIPNKCSIDVDLMQQIKIHNKVLGHGGFGVVYEYNGFAYKATKKSNEQSSLKIAINEYSNLKKYSNIDKNYFMDDIECFVSISQNQGVFIIKLPLMGDNLNYLQNVQDGGRRFFQIQQIYEDINFRYSLYLRMFEQLKIIHENNDMHMDIKPDNLMTNIKLQDILSQEKQNIMNLQLNIVDFGLIQSQNSNRFAGTFNYMHPYYSLRTIQHAQKQMDVYSFSLTIAIIEMFKLGYDVNHFFRDHSNLKIKNFMQMQQNQPESDQKNILKKRVEEQLKYYTKYVIDNQCDQNQQEILKQLYDQQDNLIYTKFEDFNCYKCYACVLVQAFKVDINQIPTVQQMQQKILGIKMLREKQNILI